MLQNHELLCPGCGEGIDASSLREGEVLECERCAGLVLKVVSEGERLTLRQIHYVSCPLCEHKLEVPQDARPGDTLSCCGKTFRLTYEFGAYALE